MRHIVSDLLHLPHQRFDAVEHRIEIHGEFVPFVTRAVQGYPLAEAALHDGTAGRVDGFDAAHCAPRDEHAGDPSEREYQQDTQGQGRFDLARELIKVVDVFSHQQMAAVREGLERRPQQLVLARTKVAPPAGAFHGRWPVREVAGERSERRVSEQVNAAIEALVRETLRDRGDQSAASRARVGFLENREFRHDRVVRPAAHEEVVDQ